MIWTHSGTQYSEFAPPSFSNGPISARRPDWSGQHPARRYRDGGDSLSSSGGRRLSANHHVIDYNSNPAFPEALNPKVTLASTYYAVVGWETLLRLEEYGDVYITGRVPAHEAAGDIVLISDNGESYSVEGHSYTSK